MSKYDRDDTLNMLKGCQVHSPEQSETDSENEEGKRRIVVYDYSWRSDEVCQPFSLKCICLFRKLTFFLLCMY
jgi:hypothetical protein